MCRLRLNRIILFLFFSLILINCDSSKDKSSSLEMILSPELKSVDGPYIFDLKDSLRIIRVVHDHDSVFGISKQTIRKSEKQQFSTEVGNEDNDSFSFLLKEAHKIPKGIHGTQENIFVTSDVEGNFNTFYSMLVGNKIMDSNFNWIFGKGHLVIAGDMMDRGKDVMPCLWLLYRLEMEAKEQGGEVHFILGNHDVMNLQIDIRYVRSKYKKLAKIISGEEEEKKAYQFLMSKNNELVKWIASKNAIEKVGDNLILHGGISLDVVDADLSIDTINELIRKHVFDHLMKNPIEDKKANLVFSRMGPLWYRGLVIDYKDYYKKNTVEEVDAILEYYGVNHIIVGHTIVDDKVTSDFNGKVIRVDIKHPKDKFSGKSRALLIENDIYYMVNDKGDKTPLQMN